MRTAGQSVMEYCDIHIHLLSDSDDGPGTDEQMHDMLHAVYADGTRTLCLTPHYHPGFFGHNAKASAAAFERLRDFAARTYPDMRLFLGNELRYEEGCLEWLATGECRTLNGTDNLLVDFALDVDSRTLVRGVERLLNYGYTPVLAHAERYRNLSGSMGELEELKRNGVLIQVDAGSLFREFGFDAYRRVKVLLKRRLADIVASDGHDLKRRVPRMGEAFRMIAKKYDKNYAEVLCKINPMTVIYSADWESIRYE